MRSASERLVDLVHQLMTTHRECEWVEFKHNNADSQEIGEYVSALANSAALRGKDAGYVVWDVRDGDRAPVGTTFDPRAAKVGGEELLHWLTKMLSPQVELDFSEVS
ncbi:MAG: ATP-binding protein, partial [Candidatus Nanopelagicales bacterium]